MSLLNYNLLRALSRNLPNYSLFLKILNYYRCAEVIRGCLESRAYYPISLLRSPNLLKKWAKVPQ